MIMLTLKNTNILIFFGIKVKEYLEEKKKNMDIYMILLMRLIKVE